MKYINKFIENNIKTILTIFILIQPLLDTITGITVNKFNLNIPIAPTIRLLFILFCICYVFYISKEKKYIKKLLLIFIYFLAFISFMFFTKRQYLAQEISNLLNTFYLPIVVIGLLNIFEHKKIKLNINLITITYFIYIVLIVIPNLTHTAFSSYKYSKVGNIGWFPLANVIGNSLSILLPLIIYFIINWEKRYIIKLIMAISIIYVFSSIGTKVPILSLAICITSNFIYFFIKWIKEKQKIKIISTLILSVTIIIISIILVPKTSFYKNIEIHKNYLGINSYKEILTDYNMIDHFIFSQRLTFLKTIHDSNKETNFAQKFIGLGHVKKYNDEISTKTIEIDYLDVIYENGILGTFVFFYIMIPLFIQSLKKFKTRSLINLEYKISIMLILIITFFAGHMLTSAAASIYVALILTFIIKGGFYEKLN